MSLPQDNTFDKKLVRIFWTGGFDSTCRVVQLSRLNVIIQPYYLVDSKYRRSVQYELNAISQVRNDIEIHPETRCVFKPLVKVDVSELTPDMKILAAFKRVRQEIAIGMQYEWLARFALNNPELELCLERAESGRIFNYFNKLGTLRSIRDGVLSYIEFDKTGTDQDLLTLFGNFRFPIPIREKTKLELVEEYKRLGFESTMNKTWFCHNPVNDEPCGVCNPCKIVVKEGLLFRMTPAAMKRHSTEMKYNGKLWFMLMKKLRWRIQGY